MLKRIFSIVFQKPKSTKIDTKSKMNKDSQSKKIRIKKHLHFKTRFINALSFTNFTYISKRKSVSLRPHNAGWKIWWLSHKVVIHQFFNNFHISLETFCFSSICDQLFSFLSQLLWFWGIEQYKSPSRHWKIANFYDIF